MKRFAAITIVIATSSISTMAASQEVYRCGNAYSQKPCPQGVVVDVQDARTAAQKGESDAMIKRETAAANAMEKARLKEEATQRATAKKKPREKDKKTAAKPKRAASASQAAKTGSAHRKSKRRTNKEPELFTTGANIEKPKPAASASK